MARFFGLILAATFAIPTMAVAQSERVRGTIESVEQNSMTVQTPQGGKVKVALTDATKYVTVVKSSLSKVAKGSFIGTATKGSGDFQVALEVVVFPPSMRGTGEGHYGWDALPDTTLAGGGSVASSMTNGTVAQKSNRVENNKVNSVEGNDVTVNFNGGTTIVTVTSDTKVVTLVPGDRSELKPNAKIFIPAATRTPDGALEANRVTVGKDGIPPPM